MLVKGLVLPYVSVLKRVKFHNHHRSSVQCLQKNKTPTESKTNTTIRNQTKPDRTRQNTPSAVFIEQLQENHDMMNTRPYIKQEHINLGDPLPLTYPIPTTTTTTTTGSSSQRRLNNAARAYIREPSTSLVAELNLPKKRQLQDAPRSRDASSSSSSSLVDRIMNNRQTGSRSSSLSATRERIRDKLRHLSEEFVQLKNTEENMVIVDAKIDELLELIRQLQDQEGATNPHEDTEDEVQRLLQEITETNSKSRPRVNKAVAFAGASSMRDNIWTFAYNSRYWLLFTATLVFVFLLASSPFAEEFKYRYCYYFC
ncbi:uncharacterized protein LODBEIA_P37630 [Lodderomyces beijingensis]|uniref:Uncharacterized protein n=1 Tax=Lodderomyces beijingensis TaxID=1775926 RepID=A0ABP0ZN28_9ASCO